MSRKFLTLPGAIAASLFLGCTMLLAGCGDKATEPFADAAVAARNDAPADVISMPDGFSNVATKCDHGNRVYVIFKADSSSGSVAVSPADPTCR